MKKFITAALLVSALALTSTAGAATIVNQGFEAGLTGWDALPDTLASTVSTFTEPAVEFNDDGTPLATYNPFNGNSFAVLRAGETGEATTLTQLINMTVGETVSFAVAFAGGDYLVFDDSADFSFFDIQDPMNNLSVFSQSITQVGDFGNTPWTIVSYTAQTTGLFRIEASVQNNVDRQNDSFLLIDAVPEPSTWMMMLFGFGAIGFAMRRKQNVRVSFA